MPKSQLSTREWLMTTLRAFVAPAMEMPVEFMFLTVVLLMARMPPPARRSWMPRAVPPKSPSSMQSSMKTFVPVVPALPEMLMPIRPLSKPLKLRLRRRTVLRTSPTAVKLSKGMLMPLVPALRIEAKISWQSMVIDLVMVTAPKPPGSRQLISPLTAVFEIAPAKVLQGAVREQGLASSPTPETHVRDACAWAAELSAIMKTAKASAWIVNRNLFIWSLLFDVLGWLPVEHGSVPATVAPSLPIVEEKFFSIMTNHPAGAGA